tara:strand:+ start:55549 stop:56073 length:525 start_codon:yes stop_codon:yes gene_type:complete
MPPTIRPAATIPYEIASDIEYAERHLRSFDRLAFSDHKQAVENIRRAVDAYGRLWGRLVGLNGFLMDECLPFPIRLARNGSYVPEPLPVDPIVEKAVEVAVVLAGFYMNPLASGKGIDKATLLSELARRDRLANMVKTLGDLLRDRLQQDVLDCTRYPINHFVFSWDNLTRASC